VLGSVNSEESVPISSSTQAINGETIEAIIRAVAVVTLQNGGSDLRLSLLAALAWVELVDVFNAHPELEESAINRAVGGLMERHSITGAEFVDGFHSGLHRDDLPIAGELRTKTDGGETIH
jgi:hypothetical protein